jgi:hypothetical protein
MKENEVLWCFVRDLEKRVNDLEALHDFLVEIKHDRVLVGCYSCGGVHWEGEGCPGEEKNEKKD